MRKQNSIDYQPLRIHPGWTVVFHHLLDLDPATVPPDDEDVWLFKFTQDLFYIHYNEIYGLDVGWYPEADPNGTFGLQFVTHQDFETILSIETRRLDEIADVIDKITWGVSQGVLPSSDSHLTLEKITPPIRLLPLKIHKSWTIERNNFMDLDPNKLDDDSQVIWLNFTDDLLCLKGYHDKQIRLGWEPAGDPSGRYVLRVIDPNNKKNSLRTFNTRNNEEVVDWIEMATLDML
ncbi:hypothetical protein JQC72_15285 [Polycladomyces sp. WAk]|uniref:Uncharacterized protein n=1 Tax=Polycladomyces zharkentensis TaxID=2807616 RepID=A0ABS2WMR1_9BACL|nr:hypothetical protein [Polycladomyces sp. WAk]MBN2910862.1 hypothetical protein [Polycladomyces sp. WAk]